MSRSQISQEKLMDAVSIAQAATAYSSSKTFHACTGSAAMFIVSTAGSITVSQQCSRDGTNWYDPVDAAGSALGVVATALTVTTGKYIAFSPVLSEFIRYKVVEGNVGATVVTITLLFRVEV